MLWLVKGNISTLAQNSFFLINLLEEIFDQTSFTDKTVVTEVIYNDKMVVL